MKTKTVWKNGLLVFNNVAIRKERETFYGVYRYSLCDDKVYGNLITHADSLNHACKKAQLIEVGYEMCKNNI